MNDLGLVKGFLCVLLTKGQFVYFVCFGVFSPVCFVFSVPVQVIAWKDSSLKSPNYVLSGKCNCVCLDVSLSTVLPSVPTRLTLPAPATQTLFMSSDFMPSTFCIVLYSQL